MPRRVDKCRIPLNMVANFLKIKIFLRMPFLLNIHLQIQINLQLSEWRSYDFPLHIILKKIVLNV